MENTYRLSCGHEYHEFASGAGVYRWQKQTCPSPRKGRSQTDVPESLGEASHDDGHCWTGCGGLVCAGSHPSPRAGINIGPSDWNNKKIKGE